MSRSGRGTFQKPHQVIRDYKNEVRIYYEESPTVTLKLNIPIEQLEEILTVEDPIGRLEKLKNKPYPK